MISSNASKVFTAVLLVFTFTASCRFWPGTPDGASDPNAAEDIKSEIPFETKEPDVYQAEIIITTYVKGESSERRIRTARNGLRIRNDYPDGITFLQTGEHERVLIDSARKIFTRIENTGSRSEDSLKDLLTTQWLNEKRDAKYEKIGSENGLMKYRAMVDGSVDSEILIFVDEKLGIPVRQEFYQVAGDSKTLVYSMEMTNVKLQTEERQFELPSGFREMPLEEFQKMIRE